MDGNRATKLILSACVAWAAQGQPGVGVSVTQPLVGPDGLQYPSGSAIPRNLTDAERRWLQTNPLITPRDFVGAPRGPIHCAAEYEPMQAILLSWNGASTWLSIVTQMANRITRVGDAEAWVVVRDAAAEGSARTQITNGNADMTKVRFFRRALDTIWIRDYGPRYIFQGDVRAIVDHTYNRPRPNDDTLPVWIGQQLRQPVYHVGLIHGGGNFHLDAVNRGYATRLINNENPGKPEAEIVGRWLDFQGLNMTLLEPYPANVDSTQHLDMWMQVVADNRVIVSDWPLNRGSTQDRICNETAIMMASRGYSVYRTPALSVSGTHYTYTNTVMCNNMVLLPSYTNATVSPYNAQALAVWQQAAPGKLIQQINCQAIVTAAGVMHCIAMHIPKPRGGVNPTAFVLAPFEPATIVAPGDSLAIRWASDDDRGTTTADVLFSRDGGTTYTPLAVGIPDTGSFEWTVPEWFTGDGVVRIAVRDAEGNQGWANGPGNVIIRACDADANADGLLDGEDIAAFVECFEGVSCAPGVSADADGDGWVNGFDYDAFVESLEAGCS